MLFRSFDLSNISKTSYELLQYYEIYDKLHPNDKSKYDEAIISILKTLSNQGRDLRPEEFNAAARGNKLYA